MKDIKHVIKITDCGDYGVEYEVDAPNLATAYLKALDEFIQDRGDDEWSTEEIHRFRGELDRTSTVEKDIEDICLGWGLQFSAELLGG